jgi:hypothetical protein
VTRRIDPRVATVRVETEPASIPARVLGHAAAPSPQQASVIDGASASIAVPATATVGGAQWRFLRWDDGSTSADRVVTVRGTTVRRAAYGRPDAAPAPAPAPAGPGPLGPTAPPEAGLDLHLDAGARAHLARRLRLRATCTVACRMTAAGTLRGVPAKARKLPRVRRHAGADRAIRLTLVLSRARVAAVRRRLRGGHRVSLRVVVTATGAAGQQVRRRATIRLVR